MIDDQSVFLSNNDATPPGRTDFNDPLLNTVEKVLSLLAKADCVKVCIGNPDKKFDAIRDKRKGRFGSQKGTVMHFCTIYCI